ncbi:uncharacterized protein LOC134269972 [Saccostrea cucullata]|uniref:uncharacterized protein LOC134269972 n=1 Tax=Saccostrea cuccullata TaxID=36930 RepID=UPI002ED40F0D
MIYRLAFSFKPRGGLAEPVMSFVSRLLKRRGYNGLIDTGSCEKCFIWHHSATNTQCNLCRWNCDLNQVNQLLQIVSNILHLQLVMSATEVFIRISSDIIGTTGHCDFLNNRTYCEGA